MTLTAQDWGNIVTPDTLTGMKLKKPFSLENCLRISMASASEVFSGNSSCEVTIQVV
jgi:hypothetical protein